MAKPILIIDPGHGGKDPGGGTNQHWKEKDLVLKISLYQFNRYKELGVPVAITRTTDVYLSPEERTKIVRNSGATYCHSNHINAGKGDGAEVIHSIYDKTKMAQMIADEIKECGQNVRRVFTRTLPGNNRADYYFMIRDTGNVITNIIEYGFADSPKDDVQQLLNYWKDYAEAVVKAFCEFIGHKYVAPGKGNKKVNEFKHEILDPSMAALNKAIQGVLHDWEKEDPELSDIWRKKFEKRELTTSDAIGLLFIGVQRGYIK